MGLSSSDPTTIDDVVVCPIYGKRDIIKADNKKIYSEIKPCGREYTLPIGNFPCKCTKEEYNNCEYAKEWEKNMEEHQEELLEQFNKKLGFKSN